MCYPLASLCQTDLVRGGFFLGLVIIGTGVESKGIERVVIIASGVLLIGITLYVASDEINP